MSRLLLTLVCSFLCFAPPVGIPNVEAGGQKNTRKSVKKAKALASRPLGWIENAVIMDVGLPMIAKLDSGAKTTSINAEILKIVKPKGKNKKDQPQRVIFTVTNKKGDTATLEKDIVRWVRIKNRPKDLRRRPVVHLEVCLAGLTVEGEVNLSERDGLNYPLLVGRNMLKPTRILIDSRKKYTHDTDCPIEDKQSDAQ